MSRPGRWYDATQAGALLIRRPCCGRAVYATHPQGPCSQCGDPYQPKPKPKPARVERDVLGAVIDGP